MSTFSTAMSVLGSVPTKLRAGTAFATTGEEFDQDFVGAFNHVVVGDDIAVRGNHKAGPKRR